MKKIISFLFTLLLLFQLGCKSTEPVKEDLSFLLKIKNDLGGVWAQEESMECFGVSITDSKRVLAHKDSIDYYATLVGRGIINAYGAVCPCMKLEIKDSKKSNENSYTMSYSLSLIERFMDKDIEEFLLIKEALDVAELAKHNKLEEALHWYNSLSKKQLEHSFVRLANVYILHESGNKRTAEKELIELVDWSEEDDMLYKYIGVYYYDIGEIDHAITFFKKAFAIDKSNHEHLHHLAYMYYTKHHYDSSAIYYTQVIEENPEDVKAYFTRAYCYFKLDQTEAGCADIHKLLSVAPELSLPDSISKMCSVQQ